MLNPDAYKLTLEQQFQLRKMGDEISDMEPNAIKELLFQASRLLMLKDNVIKDLTRQVVIGGGIASEP